MLVFRSWALMLGADFAICLSLSLISTFSGSGGWTPVQVGRAITQGALAFVIVELASAFLFSNLLWIKIARSQFRLSVLPTALGSTALLAASILGIHLYGTGLRYAHIEMFLDPVIISGLCGHALAAYWALSVSGFGAPNS